MFSDAIEKELAGFDVKPKLIKYRAILAARDSATEEKKLRPIYDEFQDDKRRHVEEVTNIADKYQIARVKHRRPGEQSEILYHVYVEFKRTNTCCYSFDEALIEAISSYHKCGQAAIWIVRMLGIKSEPEFEG